MTPDAITALVDGTWPPAAHRQQNGWVIREGRGAGSRVSAASQCAPDAQVQDAEAAMRALGQTPLFMIRSGEDALDTALAAKGYAIKDPVNLYTIPTADLATDRPPPVTTFQVWPPLACQAEIWAEGGIHSPRLDVMARVAGPKTTILGRLDDTPAGTLFAAIHDGTAMLHAIETAARFRRRGLARHMMIAAAFWAQENGADTVALLVTKANAAANPLYASLGMAVVGGYHYRIHPEA